MCSVPHIQACTFFQLHELVCLYLRKPLSPTLHGFFPHLSPLLSVSVFSALSWSFSPLALPREWFSAWALADVSVAAGHTDRSGLGSVLRDLVKPGDENLREMNKKLQNMLEEQLTKNMHLHKASVAYQPTHHTAPGSPASPPIHPPCSWTAPQSSSSHLPVIFQSSSFLLL